MRFKKWIAGLLLLCMVMAFVPMRADAVAVMASGECGEDGNPMTWTLTADGCLTISGTGVMYSGVFVPWRQYVDQVKSLVIEEGVTSFMSVGFMDMHSNLTSVSLPSTLDNLPNNAFYGTAITEIVIPAGVKTVNAFAFLDCTTLTKVIFRGDMPEMRSVSGQGVFHGCTVTVYYPANNTTWTKEKMDACDGDITWVPYGDTVSRLYGDDRWATSLEVADEMKSNLGADKFGTILIASGMNFADALSGSYLATVKKAPILLCWNGDSKYDYLNNKVVDYVKANLAKNGTVYILGGTAAVPKSLEDKLSGVKVRRLAGKNRFETNLLILEEAGIGSKDVLVCTGTNFADSLSASATGLPILLVYQDLTDDQLSFLSENFSNNDFRIIGGESAVSADVELTLAEGGYKFDRLAGSNRFETSVMIAEEFFDSTDSAVLAYAWNYPDGLCGGALAYTMNAPLILTMNKYEAEAAAYIKGQAVEEAIVLGGSGLISDKTVRTIFGMAGNGKVVVK